MAGGLSPEDGLRLVAERGAAMQEACDAQPGTMAAVLDCRPTPSRPALPDGVWPANDNAPLHVVVSGRVGAVGEAGPLLKEAGARRVLPLQVDGAFHTPLMEPARPRLEAALAVVTWRSPLLPVLSGSWPVPTTMRPRRCRRSSPPGSAGARRCWRCPRSTPWWSAARAASSPGS